MIKCHFSDVAAGNIIFSNRLTSLKSRLSASLDRYRVQISAIRTTGGCPSTSPRQGRAARHRGLVNHLAELNPAEKASQEAPAFWSTPKHWSPVQGRSDRVQSLVWTAGG